MNDYESRYELLNDKCNLIKNKVLDIGSKNGQDLLAFNQHGFTQLLGIDNEMNKFPTSNMFVYQLLKNNEIKCEENKFYFITSSEEKYDLIKLFEVIRNNKELKSRFEKLQSEISLLQVDFNDYPREFDQIKKFNLVMCSFVLHFYPSTKDNELINKLQSLLLPEGYLYIKVHNLERFHSYNKNYTDEQSKNVEYNKTLMTITERNWNNSKEVTWYLFDSLRIENYVKSFKLIYLSPEEKDFSELILQNKK